jgi:hypothetical protein
MIKHCLNTVKHCLPVEKDRGNACRKNQEKKTSRFFLANFFRGLSFYGADCSYAISQLISAYFIAPSLKFGKNHMVFKEQLYLCRWIRHFKYGIFHLISTVEKITNQGKFVPGPSFYCLDLDVVPG